MYKCIFALAFCVATLGNLQPSLAQANSGPEYETIMKASFALMSFDMMEQRCAAKGGFSQSETSALDVWKQQNSISAMREKMQAIRSNSKQDGYLKQAVTIMENMLDKNGANSCQAAMKLIATPEAQFATLIPALVSSTPKAAKKAPSHNIAGAQPTKSSSAGQSGLAQNIDSFGFDTRMIMGVGGFLTTDIYPVVLFRDGTALKDIAALSRGAAISEHKRNNPDKWTQWRRSGSKIEMQTRKGWEALPFPKTYASLPAGFRLDGLFRRLSGTGNVAVGGDQSATLVSDYRFWNDGTVVRGGSAGAAASSGSRSTIVTSTQPNMRGQYRIEGLTLSITYGDGSTESRILVADPANPKTAIWMDGAGYVRRQR